MCGVVEDVREDGATAVACDCLSRCEKHAQTKEVQTSLSSFGDALARRPPGALRLYRAITKASELPKTRKLLEDMKALHQKMGVELPSYAHTRIASRKGRAVSKRVPALDRGQAAPRKKHRE